jgi:hypothetical protein
VCTSGKDKLKYVVYFLKLKASSRSQSFEYDPSRLDCYIKKLKCSGA